jgi:apolipoprotein N-acyltransferase
VAVALVGVVAPDGAVDRRLTVAVVQGGGPRGVRAVARDPAPVFQRHVEATAGVRPPVDLVLWPEDVVDVEAEVATTPEGATLAALARSLGATLVAGVVQDEPGNRFRNSAVPWGPDGTVLPRYDKVHRVPFGEYIPARGLFERLADLSDVPRDATVGRGPAVLDTPAGRLGVVISYEVFFPERARSAVRAGGRVVLVPTNASSYRDSQIPAQEVVVARLRALETGRWVVQAAPTGYSAVVDHHGHVLARSRLGGAAVLRHQVQLRTGRTVFVSLGPAPVVLAAAATLAIAHRRRRARPRVTTGPPPG